MRQFLASISSRTRPRARVLLTAAAAAAGALLLSIGPAVAQTDDAQLSSDDGSAVSAAPAAPSIAVRVGYNGMAKIGNWLPVAVQVSNEGNSVAGELQIQVDDNQTGRRASFNLRPPSVYTVPATLPSHSRKQYQIDVFLPFPAKDLTVKLVTDQGNVVQQTGTLQALSGSEVLCGTLARNQDFFQQLKNLDLPGRQGKKPFVVPLTTQDIPSRQHAMSSLDCLIVNNISLTGLTDDQKSAILGWVEDGGLLVVGGGSGWQKTIQPLPKELMPVDVTGVKSIPSLQALADFAHQPIKGDGPWLVSTGKPLATWNGNAALWKYVLAYNTTPLAVFAFFNPYGGFATVQNWGTPPRQAIFNVNDVAPPSTRWLLVFIGLYALAAGPLNYLLLRVVGLKGLGWLTIPVFIGVGAFATNHMAQQFRGSDLVLNKISLVRAEGSSGEANVRSYVSLYSPRKGDYTLLVPGNASVTGYARPFNAPTPADATGGNQWQLKVTENDTTNRVDMPLEASNTGSFLADSNVHYSGKIDSDLKVKDNTISGTVTYHTGHLNNGEKKNVDFTYSPSAPSAAPDPQKIKAALAASGKSGDTSRDNILDTFLGSNNSSQPAGLSGLTLLGWLDKSPLPVEV